MDLAGIALIITAAGGIVLQLRKNKKATIDRLDNITVLVDGRYGQVLRELAEVKALVAELTGLQDDKDRAELAKKLSDDHVKLEGKK